MIHEDDVAIENAALLRRHREREREAFDAAKAEMPRVLGDDVKEHWQWLRRLIRKACGI